MSQIRAYILTLLLACASLVAGEPVTSSEKPAAWEIALAEFDKAGALVAQGKFDAADALLKECEAKLPSAYSRLAATHREILAKALSHSEGEAPYNRFGLLGQLCGALHAHAEAAELLIKATQGSDPKNYRRTLAFHLGQSGQTDKALAEYDAAIGSAAQDPVNGTRLKNSLRLYKERSSRSHEFAFMLPYIQGQFLSAGDDADWLGALREFKRLMPMAGTAAERAQGWNSVLMCLERLGDSDELSALGDRLLVELKADVNFCAAILAQRAKRAQESGKLDEALVHLRRILNEFSGSRMETTFRTSLISILRQQQKYEEAIGELRKLVEAESAQKNPAALLAQAHRKGHALLAISECYESMNDMARAFESALAANEFREGQGCSSCDRYSLAEKIRARIERLQNVPRH